MASGNFSVNQGDSKTLSITLKNTAGTVVDITSATIKWQSARKRGGTSVISYTTSNNINITSGTGGTFDVTIDASDTEPLDGIYYHETEITFSDGTISTVMTGTMTVTPVHMRST